MSPTNTAAVRRPSSPFGDAAYRETARLFRVLGDPSRLKLLDILLDGPLFVGELAAALGDSMPAVSQRLKLMRSERIVAARRLGKRVQYRLADDHVRHLLQNGLTHATESDCLEPDRTVSASPRPK